MSFLIPANRLLHNHRLTLCAAVTIGLLAAANSHANPNSAEPGNALASHGTIDGADELIKSMYELYNLQEKLVVDLQERRNDPASLPIKQIATASGQTWKAKRDAEHLQLMGEPAGHDLSIRFQRLSPEFKKLALACKAAPPGGKHYQTLKSQLQRETPKRERFLTQAQKALEDGKLEIFETTMEKYGVDLYEKIAFFSPTEAAPFTKDFDAVLARGDMMLRAKRKASYFETAKAAMANHLAPSREFVSEATRIRDEIAAGGSATLGEGVTGDAPQAFAHVAKLWGNASAGLLRVAALQWAFLGKSTPEVNAEAKKLAQTAERSLAMIIEAAATSTPPDQAAVTYSELLKEISVVDRRIGGNSLSNACESALAKFAAKDPVLKAQVAAYQRATSEPLAWRKGFAMQQGRMLEKEYPQASLQLTAESPVTKTIKPSLFGGVSTRPVRVASPHFSGPANWQVYETATRLVGKPITDWPMLRLTPTSGAAVVPYREYHYAYVPVPMPSESQVDDLKHALLVDEMHPPLSIAAADAISSAELHDYQKIGGMVSKVHLESTVTRFIALPDVAYLLAPLGSLPILYDDSTPATQACWRLDVTPHWAQHDYFVVTVDAAAQ